MTRLNHQIKRWLREIAKDVGPFDEEAAMQLVAHRLAWGDVGEGRKAIRQALEEAAREVRRV